MPTEKKEEKMEALESEPLLSGLPELVWRAPPCLVPIRGISSHSALKSEMRAACVVHSPTDDFFSVRFG